jgi:glycerophosphoryl diester phosphodiesterase
MITAHRGASYDAPENTLAAFQLAWEQGADAVEGDFHLTADRQIICIHDRDTERVAGAKKVVEKSSFEELRKLDVGSWKAAAFASEVAPSFEEVFATVPESKTFVIELKTGVAIVPVLVEELKRLNAKTDWLLVISFDASTIAAFKQLMPNVRAHWLTDFKKLNTKDRDSLTKKIVDTVRSCHADGVGFKGDRQYLDQDLIEAIGKEGVKKFHVWTVDDPADAKFFLSLGAAGITTNRPALIRESLQ